MVTAWSSLVVNSSLLQPAGSGTGSGTITVLDASTALPLASSALNVGGDTTIDLSGIEAASHQTLEVQLSLASAGQATPKVNSLKVAYTTQPAAITLTLGASPQKIVFGHSATLSGTVAQGTALAGVSVGLSGQGAGDPGFTALPPATSDSSGAFGATVKPVKNTTYEAAYGGAMSPTVSVGVAYRVTLRITHKGGALLFRGKVAPKRRGRVTVQIRTRSGWKTIGRAKLSKKSAFRLLRTVKRGKHKFRALTTADSKHLAGKSRVVSAKS
jgi:hypothetical protein